MARSWLCSRIRPRKAAEPVEGPGVGHDQYQHRVIQQGINRKRTRRQFARGGFRAGAQIVSLTGLLGHEYRRLMQRIWTLLLLLGGACTQREEPAPAPEAAPPAESAPAPEPKAPAPLPDPVAKVGEVEISKARFEAGFKEVLRRYRRADDDIRPELRSRLRANLVRRLVEAEVIRQKAVELEVDPSPEAIEAAWAEHKKGFGSEEGFAAFVNRSGSTEEGLHRSFIENLRRSRVIEAGVPSNEPTVAELRSFYDTHPGYFDRPAEVRLRQLLLRVPPAEELRVQARAKAEEALGRLRKGESFETVWTNMAADSADPRKGDLGFLPRNRLPKPVGKVAFDELKTGQLSGVIESPFGFHVVRKEAERPPRTLSFDEARPLIEQRMSSQRRNKGVRTALEKWKTELEIKVFTGDDVSGPAALQPGLVAPSRIDAPAQLRIEGARESASRLPSPP